LADEKSMHSFNRKGSIRWTRPIKGVPLSAQFTPDGDLLFITHIGVIYMLDRHTGRPVQPPHALIPGAKSDPSKGLRACMRGLPDCPSANTPAIDLRNGRLYYTFWAPGAPNAGVRAMRLPSLEALWSNETLPGGSASSPDLSADGQRLYLTDNAGHLNALDAASGRLIWTLPIGYSAGGSVSVSPDGLIMPAGGRGAPLMAVQDRGSHGAIVWRNEALNNFGVATQAAGFKAYPTVSTGRGTADLLVVDTRTGRLLDRETIPGSPRFTVGTTIDANGTVYVATISGDLHAFRPATPAPR
jgi:outer membrane protein assembly factor BamB